MNTTRPSFTTQPTPPNDPPTLEGGKKKKKMLSFCSCGVLILLAVLLGFSSPGGVEGARFIGTIKSPESWVYLAKYVHSSSFHHPAVMRTPPPARRGSSCKGVGCALDASEPFFRSMLQKRRSSPTSVSPLSPSLTPHAVRRPTARRAQVLLSSRQEVGRR